MSAERVVLAAYGVVDVEEASAGGQPVRVLEPLQASDRQEHADGRAEGEEVHLLEVQSLVHHRHLQDGSVTSFLLL